MDLFKRVMGIAPEVGEMGELPREETPEVTSRVVKHVVEETSPDRLSEPPRTGT